MHACIAIAVYIKSWSHRLFQSDVIIPLAGVQLFACTRKAGLAAMAVEGTGGLA